MATREPQSRMPRVDPAEDARIRAGLAQIHGILVPDERVEAYAVERRVFALTHRRTVVAATSGRLIAMYRGLFGGFRLHDVRWQDLQDARLRAGILGADLSVVASAATDLASAGHAVPRLTLAGLRKDQAQSLYRICQAQEQAWREKRRVRELEELRARSGGVQVGLTGAPGSSAGGGATVDDPVARLQRAKEMLDKRLITDAEYESLKAKLLAGF